MKNFIFAAVLMGSSAGAFATTQVEYQCGPYIYGISGADYTYLVDSQGNELGRWEGDAANDPTYGTTDLYLRWEGQEFRCNHLSTFP